MTQTLDPSGVIKTVEVSDSLFAVIPGSAQLFAQRAKRLKSIAAGHPLEPYLLFAAAVSDAQERTARALPEPHLPSRDALKQAGEYQLLPLARTGIEEFGEADKTVLSFFGALQEAPIPAEAAAALAGFFEAPAEIREDLIRAALQDSPPENVSQRVLLLAGLQVYFSKLAGQLTASDLQPVADTA